MSKSRSSIPDEAEFSKPELSQLPLSGVAKLNGEDVGAAVAEKADKPEKSLAEQREEELEFRRFNWLDEDSIVLHEQPAVAVYENTTGGVVIRQERPWDQDDDIYIIIQRQNVPAIVAALQRVAGE